jgi:hypothetical protein
MGEGHGFAGCGKTHVLCQGTTLVGPKTARLMRALAPEVGTACKAHWCFLYARAEQAAEKFSTKEAASLVQLYAALGGGWQ